MTKGSDIFFSYSRQDSEFALRLARDLRARDVGLWLDQLDIPAGEPWDRSIQQAIQSCGSMLVVLTPHSVASENVMDEVSYALDQGDRVVPVLLEPCEVPLRIRRLQYVDFTSGYEVGLAKLERELALPARHPQDETSPAEPARVEPRPGGLRRKLIVAVVATLLVATFVALKSRSRERTDRRQTSIAGTGMVAVPSLIGVARDRALATLTRLQLEGEVLDTQESCSKPAGTVLRQDPAGMTQAPAGSRIRLVIAERKPIPIPRSEAGLTVLAPTETHPMTSRTDSRTTIRLRLVGDPCAAGTVSISHPTAGVENYTLKAGESADATKAYGPGTITIVFRSLNEGARLAVKTD